MPVGAAGLRHRSIVTRPFKTRGFRQSMPGNWHRNDDPRRKVRSAYPLHSGRGLRNLLVRVLVVDFTKHWGTELSETARIDIHDSDTPLLCRSCEVRHKGLCGSLDAAQLLAMAKHTRMTRYEAGKLLAGEETPIQSYANVMRGVVKLTKVLENGRQQVVGLQFAPDFLGRLFGRENAVTAEAASDVELCEVPRAAFERLMVEYPQMEHRLFGQVLRELDEARDWMVTLGQKTAAEKVASLLYLIAGHIAPSTGTETRDTAVFDLPLSRIDIAEFLGLTIETVSRQITKLRSEGVISVVANRQITVPSLSRLKARCC